MNKLEQMLCYRLDHFCETKLMKFKTTLEKPVNLKDTLPFDSLSRPFVLSSGFSSANEKHYKPLVN